jgi:nucleotide-binding universal stress UspA family protein
VSRSILVPLDGSVQARSALPIARTLARLSGATVHLLHVSEPALRPADAVHRLAVTGEAGVMETCAGSPAAAILAAVRRWHAETVVMSTHAGHPRRGRGLGSVAEAVLAGAGVPVVFVRPERGEQAWDPHALLLPLDGSPTSAGAMGHAIALAASFGGRIELLHVTGPQQTREPEAGAFGAPYYADQPQHEWPAWSGEFVARARCGCGHDQCPIHLHVAHGQPGPETVRFASEHAVDMIVVSWRGRFEADRAATVRAVLEGAPCPVVVIKV